MDVDELAKKEQEAFTALVSNVSAPISALLRVHLIIEGTLEQIIRNQLQSPKSLLEEGRLTFNQKILLVGSFGVLDKKVYNAIRRLNSMRNDCVHNLEAELDRKTVEEFGDELRPWFTKIKKDNPDDHEQWLSYILPYLAGKIAGIAAKSKA